MRNLKITIEYDGTNYRGWQIQNSHKSQVTSHNSNKTIQGILEQALRKILREKIRVIGSGRTDSGVHAQNQVANFKTKTKIGCQEIQRCLNGVLPSDIRVKGAEEASADFHARFSARAKLYRYTIVNDSFASPFLRRYAHLVKSPLDVRKMQEASRLFLGRRNLRSFQAVDKKMRPAVRAIKRLNVRRVKNLIYIEIEAKGFLYRMARNIAGTLIEVGRGKLQPQAITSILAAKNRVFAGPCAPAKGLCLLKVAYL